MTTLHLGVFEATYADTHPITTGDVAEILEAHYGIMAHFFIEYEDKIASDLEKSVQGALENVLNGAPAGINPFGDATSDIETKFKDFLVTQEVEKMGIPSVPTMAALEGRSKRFKYKKGPRRPSFIDTGLYQTNFKAWIDDAISR